MQNTIDRFNEKTEGRTFTVTAVEADTGIGFHYQEVVEEGQASTEPEFTTSIANVEESDISF